MQSDSGSSCLSSTSISSKVIAILEKKGFVLKRVTGSHYIFTHADTKRRVTVPFHSQDVARGTLLQILKDAGISREELQDFL